MATYFWVGGSGTWNTTSATNWAITSGGTGGAGVPTAADAVVLDVASGAVTVTLGENVSVLTFNASAFTGTLAFSTFKIVVTGNNTTIVRGSTTMTCTGTRLVECNYSGSTGTRTFTLGATSITAALSIHVSAGSDIISLGSSQNVYDLNFTGFSGSWSSNSRTVYGSLTLSPTMTITAFGTITFAATSPGQTLDFGGIAYDASITFNGVGGSWAFQRDVVIGSARTLTLTSGTLDSNNNNISIGSFATGTGVKTLNMGSSTWTVTGGSWSANNDSANLTVNFSTAIINMTRATSKAFTGGGKTWPTLNQGGAGNLIIQTSSNTFANITNTVQPATITLQSGFTQTVTNFGISGTAGNLITLVASTSGSVATLVDSSGTNSVSYVSIKDIVATGGATWEAYTTNGNVDGGNNTGWLFSSAPVVVPGAGVYSPTGAIRVIKNDTSVSHGLYAADGSLRITVVTGSSYTGRYATDGSLNVVNESGSLYHPCGAIRGVPAITTYTGRYSPSGALYMAGLA